MSEEKERVIKKAQLISGPVGVEENNSFGSDHFSFCSAACIQRQGNYKVATSLIRTACITMICYIYLYVLNKQYLF